ncbi:glycoside hydrolase family 43 protein [Deinococcus sp.]|uniref:glycoside hydrolase family 43 protein n=1 Tax=Deinococcus sp. TaxID=47478 RepID=UPI0025CF02FA|nr:glycoside hydrolase family 43 protein [Deinococcus sp.]
MKQLKRALQWPRQLSLATEDLPDPNVLAVSAGPDRCGYYIYATNIDAGNARRVNVPVVFSPDLGDFTLIGDALPVLPDWARPGFTWAPEVTWTGQEFRLYFTARLRGTGRQVIGVASSPHPQGPFVAETTPLLTMLPQGGAIDASTLRTGDGRLFLYWKNDGNAVKRPTYLWGAELSADGLRLITEPAAVLGASELWERALVEAPQVIEDAGRFHLLYSCADYGNETYAVGHASGPSPLGPFGKDSTPLLTSYDTVAGPGHSHAFRSHSGQWHLAYHAWDAGRCGYPTGRRRLHLSPLHLDGQAARVILPELSAQASD